MPIVDFQAWLEKLDWAASNVPVQYWVAAFFLPVVLALFSGRFIVFLSAALIAGVALLLLLKLGSVTLIIAISAYVGSLLVAIFGIQARLKDSATRRELINLRVELDELRTTVGRHYVADLKRQGETLEDENR